MSAGLRNVRLLVAYDGTDFRGFAASDGVRTVMGELSAALERVVRRPVELSGAGRTDAGVHGWGQVVSGPIPPDTDLDRLQRSLNGLCSSDVAVRSVEWAEDDFDARFSAAGRSYRYDVWNDAASNPLRSRFTWHVAGALDLDAMNWGARYLLGQHDFSSFCRRPKPSPGMDEPSLVRRVDVAHWHRPFDDEPSLVRFEVTATAFCHQMVRSFVGTLVDVGLGRLDCDAIPEILAAHDRNKAGRVAPPTGLVLWHVDYEGQRWDA